MRLEMPVADSMAITWVKVAANFSLTKPSYHCFENKWQHCWRKRSMANGDPHAENCVRGDDGVAVIHDHFLEELFALDGT